MKLTGSQRKYLRAKAHHIKPSVYIGKKDIIDGSIRSIENSLKAHELIKVKFLGNSITEEDKNNIKIKLNCDIAGSIGKTLILYRQNKEEDQKIKLPK